MLQSGVITEKGPTLDEIHADEARQEAELKAKKAAALAAAEEDDEVEGEEAGLLAAAEAMESISEKEEIVEAPSEEDVETESPEEVAEEASTETEASLMKLKKDELVEKAKAAGVASSGTKADIVARLLE